LRNLTLEGCGGYVADVVVSELLGSFGDNELSPECLDSFYKTSVCRPDTISIPTRYTSYLSLVSSAKLHSQAKQQALYPNDYDSGVQGLLKAMETPYVVRTHACSQMSEEKECWTFTHPSPTPTLEHHREIILNMESKEIADYRYGNGYGPVTATLDMAVQSTTPDVAWTCTGLLGTFSADLYTSQQGRGTPQISIAPANFSMGMFSWFPLYFPISEPLLIPPGAVARVYLWRRQSLDHAKVWYEWSVAVHRDGQLLAATPIHNPGGRSYYVSMK
jgi:protein arginine N-methyltransferase 5